MRKKRKEPRKKKGEAKTTRNKLTDARRTEAKALIEELLLRGLSFRKVCPELVREYQVAPRTAENMCREVRKEMEQAILDNLTHNRREQHIARLEHLYATAFDKGKYMAALGAERALLKLEGYEQPIQLDINDKREGAVGSADDAEFEGRDHQELDYYARQGHWPEDSPEGNEPAIEPTSSEPPFPLH